MTIRYSKKFIKQLARQHPKVQQTFRHRIQLFEEDNNNQLLYKHALKGKLEGFYSINITGDIRALYKVVGDEVYLYDMIGSHSQLYG